MLYLYMCLYIHIYVYTHICICMNIHIKSYIRIWKSLSRVWLFATSLDCSPPGSSVHGNSPGKNTGVGCHALLQGIFPAQGSNLSLPHCWWILYRLSHQGSPLHRLLLHEYYMLNFYFQMNFIYFKYKK